MLIFKQPPISPLQSAVCLSPVASSLQVHQDQSGVLCSVVGLHGAKRFHSAFTVGSGHVQAARSFHGGVKIRASDNDFSGIDGFCLNTKVLGHSLVTDQADDQAG